MRFQMALVPALKMARTRCAGFLLMKVSKKDTEGNFCQVVNNLAIKWMVDNGDGIFARGIIAMAALVPHLACFSKASASQPSDLMHLFACI